MSDLYEIKLASGEIYHATEDEVINDIEGEPHFGVLNIETSEPPEFPGNSAFLAALVDAFRGLSKHYEPFVICAMRSDHFKWLKSRKMRWMRRVEKRKNRKRAARKRARKGGR